MVRITDGSDMTSAVYSGCWARNQRGRFILLPNTDILQNSKTNCKRILEHNIKVFLSHFHP